jgi:solute carrier family 34 (sodium-dependent phosphate cotransporter)
MKYSYSTIIQTIFIFGIAYLFLFSINLIIGSFEQIGIDTARSFLSITENPFISLFTGLLITAIIQSSSTTTSLIVAIVASGSMSFENAIPMIMGANIGTTLTSTLISLSFIAKKREYQKAFSAAIIHDLFNIIIVLILFPLEYYFNFLSGAAYKISDVFSSNFSNTELNFNFELDFTSYLTTFLIDIISNPIVSLSIAFGLLFLSIKVISKQISKTLIGGENNHLGKLLFRNPWKSFGLGVLLTAGVQSSSITTSVIVPVAASGSVSLKNIFPYIIGANIGTTLTALIAAFFISTDAITIAIIHVFFNLTGLTLFMFFPLLKSLTIDLSQKIGYVTRSYRLFGLYYILVLFFIIPFILIYLNK